MRIRSQLILAAFVLAVIPLAALVTYSYHSSRRALEKAYGAEADRVTQQMDRRLANIRADLDERLELVSALPLPSGRTSEDVASIVTVMGDAAPFIDALDFEPMRPGMGAGAPEPEDADPDPDVEVEVPEPAEVAEGTADGAVPPAPPEPPMQPTVIELPPMPAYPRYVMSEQHKELIEEITKTSVALSRPSITPDERNDLRAELQKAQEELGRVVRQEREQFHRELSATRAAQREHDRLRRERDAATLQAARTAPQPGAKASPKPKMREATAKDIAKAAEKARQSALILGRRFHAPVRQQGEVVGQVTARISSEQVIRRILGSAADDRSETPFAVDREGTVYTRNAEERARLDALGIPHRVKQGQSVKGIEGWIVSMSTDPQSGLKIGVARPVGDNLTELRQAAARNFGLGLGLVAFALIGIVPLSNHLTRDVQLVTNGAERIAHGDLMTRLPVKTNNELGQLARAFNRMAEDLSVHQQKLVEQERARKEQELQQRLLSVEYERKSVELEDARSFQLSMLPKHVPRHPSYDVAVFTRTATEVGGDYYDFHLDGDILSVTIGDATGHGAKAGTMVTVIKTLFAGYDGNAPAEFLRDAADKIKRMELGRMAMALSLARFDRGELTLSSAGMPPVLVHRAAAGSVEEIALEATPLGTMSAAYPQVQVRLERGDTVLFLSDGFPELMNDAGQQLGYTAALDAFAEAARGADADAVIAALAGFARRWHGDTPPNDDVTFVVARLT